MQALAGFLALLMLPAVPTVYRIDLKGGVTYWSSAKPDERSGRYIFRTSEGTLVSIRKPDVASIRPVITPTRPRDTLVLGPASPAAAARNQKVVAGRLRDARTKSPNGLFKQDPYRPGVGIPYPPSSNDYVVGKTFAYPPSGKVYEGPAPTNVPEGPAPMLERPSPPPPNR